MTFAGVLLAAGAGERIGMPKALIRLPDGRLLLTKQISVLREGGCSEVIVVLGASERAVRPQLEADLVEAGFEPVTIVSNPDFASGISTSIRAGLTAADATDADAVVVLLVDMPGVSPEAIAKLGALSAVDALAVATYDGVPVHPQLIGRSHFAPISAAVSGDVGARTYFAGRDDVQKVPCDGLGSPDDVDTPADLEALTGKGRTPGDVALAQVTSDEVAVSYLELLVQDDRAGATVSFGGVVRDHDHGRMVTDLHYLMHPSAEDVIKSIAADGAARVGVRGVAVAHRIGHLRVGDTALGCVVSAEHRKQAFDACAWIVEEVKAKLPIWKRQVFRDGTDEWVDSP